MVFTERAGVEAIGIVDEGEVKRLRAEGERCARVGEVDCALLTVGEELSERTHVGSNYGGVKFYFRVDE